jgi:glycosyltransferase involved in cell wall biosynthesis
MSLRTYRILSLAPTSFFNDYGCHVRILEEARALQRRGHDMTVLTYFKGNDVPGLRIIRSNPTPWRAQYEVGSSRHKLAFDALLGMRLIRVLARNRFDVIHGHLHEGALIGGVIGRMFGVPCVMDYQGSMTDEMRLHRFLRPGGLRERFWKVVERTAERSVRAIFTSTVHAAQKLHGIYGAERVIALPDGVSTSFVRPDVLDAVARERERALLGCEPHHQVIAFLGLLAEHQGVQNMIDAAAMIAHTHPNARWLVMGYPGAELWSRRAQAAGVGHLMRFTGRVPYERMPHHLALADVAVAPKLSRTEGSGKLLNYMAMALPTVAFDTPAQRELLGDCGVYAPMGDTSSFAAGIAQLLDNPRQARTLGAQAQERATALFGWDVAAETMERVYSHVVRTR